MVMERLEKVMGLPRLKEVSEVLDRVSLLLQNLDDKRLELLKRVLDTALKIQAQGGVTGLDMFSGIVQAIASADIEKLEKVERITSDIKETAVTLQRIVKSLPKGAVEQLPIKEIAAEVKKAMAGIGQR